MYLMMPEDFEPWVGRNVRISAEPEPVEVVLTGIQRLKVYKESYRQPFVLIFESDERIFLLDESYEFDCGRGGPYTILISQLQPKAGRRFYQAVFN
jgi:hypothetical protein